jgi:hypothetical protein
VIFLRIVRTAATASCVLLFPACGESSEFALFAQIPGEGARHPASG